MTTALTKLKNTGIEGTYTLPPPYAGSIPLGGSVLLADAVATVITNLQNYTGSTSIPYGISVEAAPLGSVANPYSTLAYWTETSEGAMLLAAVQTVTGAKTFNNGTLLLNNSGGTFAATVETAATAARVITLPDATCTLAQSAAATGGTAPAFTGAAPGTAPSATTAIHATWAAASGGTPGTYTQTSGGIVAAAGALIGGYITDTSGNGGTIVANTACTASTGAISVFPTAGTPATATTLIVQPPPVPVGTVASHTHVQT